MIKVYTGFRGLAFLLILTAGVVLAFSFFFWGITRIFELLAPALILMSYILIGVFIIGLLPAFFIKRLRPYFSVYSLAVSRALGVTSWIMSLIFLMEIFGFAGIFFIVLAQFMAPAALAVAMLKGTWIFVGHLALWIGFSAGMRIYSQWLLDADSPREKKGHIIDVDIIEPKGI